MYGDFLVPTNTNVNNAITTNTGAKWEKFYEYTFEDEHTEGFEFPHDIDETPLHLKGIIIEFINAVNTNISIKINGNTIVDNTFSFPSEQRVIFNDSIKNGLNEMKYYARHVVGATGSFNINTFSNSFMFIDEITDFNISVTGSQGANIKFYVLRSV